MKITFGIRTVLYTEDFEPLKNYVRAAEKLGYDNIWLNDHLLPIIGSLEKPMLESWTVLSALSTLTDNIRLGTLVLNNSFRYPQIVAKMAATLDVLSNGRLELGIGAGWFKEEHESYGIPYKKHSQRIDMLKEAIELIKKLWTGKKTTFNGKHYDLKKAVCLPRPLQKPHPPLLVGGYSKRILHIAARYATKSNFILLSSDEFAEKARLLKEQCKKVGRKYSDIKKSFFGEAMVLETAELVKEEIARRIKDRRMPTKQGKEYANKCIIGTPDQCVDRINAYMKSGAQEFMLVFPRLDTEQIELFYDRVVKCL